MNAVLTTTTVFVEIHCGAVGCDARFAVPEETYKRWKHTHEGWCCPNGHRRVFCSKTDQEKRIEQLERREQWERDRADRNQRAAETNARRAAAARGQVTKLKRRVSRGVCPCCNRTFADLARHMAGQHPDFAQADAS